MPENKYQCLVDALSNTTDEIGRIFGGNGNVLLPPIKPGGEVTSNVRPWNSRDADFPSTAKLFDGTVAIFTYPGADGVEYAVRALDITGNKTGTHILAFNFGRWPRPDNISLGHGDDSLAKSPALLLEAPTRYSPPGRPWRQPTVEDAVERVFRCLDALTS